MAEEIANQTSNPEKVVPEEKPQEGVEKLTLLEAIKIADKQGTLEDKIALMNEKQKKNLREKLNTQYGEAANVYTDMLFTQETYDNEQDVDEDGFVVKVFKGVPDVVKNIVNEPVRATENFARGQVRAFNPFPALGYNEVTVEAMEALGAYPIVRGAEMFARMFLPEDQRPPLTPLIDMVDQQTYYNEKLKEVNPGLQDASEIASIIGGAYQTGKLAYKGIKNTPKLYKTGKELIKQDGPRMVKNFIAKRKEKKAIKEVNKLKSDLQELSSEYRNNGTLVDTVINNPKAVRNFLDNTDEYSNQVFADMFIEELEGLESSLGGTIRSYRNKAYADNTTRIKVPEAVPEALAEIKKRAVVNGENILPPKITKVLDRMETIAELGYMSPRDGLILDNLLVDVAKFGEEAKDIGKTAVKEINPYLLAIRGANKNAIRGATKEGEVWARVDDHYSNFLNKKQKLGYMLRNEKGADRIVNLILNDSKGRERRDLMSMLEYVNEIDPALRGPQQFMNEIRQIKAAKGLKEIDVKFSDSARNDVDRFVQKYEDAYTKRMNVGAGVVGGAGGFVAGDASGAFLGGVGSSFAVNQIFSKVAASMGRKKALKIANPDALLLRAQKAKDLSKEAKVLANDVYRMYNHFGDEGIIKAMDVVGATPFAIELMEYIQRQPKDVKAPNKRQPKVQIPVNKEPKINIDLDTMRRRRERGQ